MVRGADGKKPAALRSPSYLPADEARSRKSEAPGHPRGVGDPDLHPSRNLNRALLADGLKGRLIQQQLIADDCHAQSLAQTTRA